MHARVPRRRGAKPISLAMQGGGAHGAFGWGVLDYLLEDGRLRVKAMTAASAGAMNAVVVSHGLLEGGNDGARAQLEEFWTAVAEAGARLNPGHGGPWEAFLKGMGLDGPVALLDALSRMSSPYDRMFFNFNPLHDILEQQIDFERLRAKSPVQLHVAATNVRTGKIRNFATHEMTPDAVIASACLPFIFKAVEVDREHYWDGGYAGNPTLIPLLDGKHPRDIVILHLTAMERDGVPTSAEQIMDRLNEIHFSATVAAELRVLAHAQSEWKGHWLAKRFGSTFRDVRVHAIRVDDPLGDLPASSKLNTDLKALHDLRDRGRAAARTWLRRAWPHIGKRSTVDLAAEFLRSEPAPAA
ncbi:MAG: patatin-like phospholipase family protein [Caulobacterales bacterium]|nr:patatin-like phospholipase family protein [Caulobacterales bacterium]